MQGIPTGDYYFYKYSNKDTNEGDEVWKVWGVSFNFGRVFRTHLSESDYVRPVRTGTDNI